MPPLRSFASTKVDKIENAEAHASSQPLARFLEHPSPPLTIELVEKLAANIPPIRQPPLPKTYVLLA
jgi:hypothetical protein